jgi:tRNA 2-thiouridine synthesizing protein D
MNFSILVGASPYQHQAADTAYHFATALLRRGHALRQVFFYHDGVQVASRLGVPPQDERCVTERWSALAASHGVDLVVCVAAAQRRGILDEKEMKRHGKDAHNLAPGFRIAGLGLLVEAGLLSDRLVTFGA